MIMLSGCPFSSRPLLLLAAVLVVESSQLDGTKVNSIKATLMGETPTQATTNRSTTFLQGLPLGPSKKGKILGQGGKGLKHYHRQGESKWIQLEEKVLKCKVPKETTILAVNRRRWEDHS
ncbi:Dickkopf-related protein 2 [Varanus komodoensis]|nr:Dickkopf-related protein 2 [Varanus komodoensis]